MSEDTVIRHGAPTLAGMKTGNLFPCFVSSPQALAEELRAMNRVLVPRGLRLVPLRREKGRALLYLFRPAALSRDLAQEEVRRLLRQAGYRDLGQGACLAELRRRLGPAGIFPMRSASSWAIPRRTWRALSATGARGASAWAAGRSTGTRPPPAASLPPSRPAPPTTAAAGPKAPPWPGWP